MHTGFREVNVGVFKERLDSAEESYSADVPIEIVPHRQWLTLCLIVQH